MLNFTLPLPYLIAATYLFLAAGGLVLWCHWDKVLSITNFLGRRFFVVVFIITTVLLGFLIANCGSSAGRSNIATSMEPQNRRDTSCPTGEQYEYSTKDRTRFESDFPKVLGYPSSGGVLMLPLDIAVAEYLGIPRLEIVHRNPNPIDEDSFCNRLRLLGAKWWKSEETYMRKLIGFEEMSELERKQGIIVGWPDKEGERGVWILRTSPDTAMLRMCVNMKERCGLLKRWGAIFYENPRDVEEFDGVFLTEQE